MRKLLPFFVVGILVLSGLGAVSGSESNEESIVSEKIFISQPTILEKEDYVSLESTDATVYSGEQDKPALPVITKVYTFPFGTKIDSVDVTFSDFTDVEVSKPIEPSPDILPISTMVSQNIEKSEEIMTYSDIEVYPEERFGYRAASGLEGEENVVYVTVSLYPDQYFPQQNIVTHAENAEIDIKYTLPETPVTFPDVYDFLIIAPEEFHNALQPLVDHKNNLDPPISTILVDLEDIPSGVGVDQQEDIKYYIKDAKENWGITYLMLVGAGAIEADPPGPELFPVRYAWIGSEGTDEVKFPSDLYYADFYNSTGGFSNWDFDLDGKYAEWNRDIPNVDGLPDVYLGKVPANNAEEVTTFVNKVIDYKAHNKMTGKIFQMGGDSFTGDPIYEGEFANRCVMTKLPGYTTTRLWGSHPNPDYETMELTKPNIKKAFMSGVDFVDWSGHGNPAGWATHPPNDASTWIPPATLLSNFNIWIHADFDIFLVLNKKKYPVAVYNSCSNNKYTKDEDCLGWKTISKKNGGGIASYAAAGIGYGSQGSSECERVMGWMEVNVFDELVSNKILGQAWGNCITEYYTTFEENLYKTDWKTLLEFSMFGDPTLVVEDGDDPKSVQEYTPFFEILLERLIDYFPFFSKILNLIQARLG
jgi:hypothetical protein